MSSGVDFTNMINNVIRPNGDGRQDEKDAIALLEAAQASELPLDELLLLIKSDIRSWLIKLNDYCESLIKKQLELPTATPKIDYGEVLANYRVNIPRFIESLTPKPQQQKAHKTYCSRPDCDLCDIADKPCEKTEVGQ